MGNCQAIDAAALVIQHPCGKIERLYWSISASEVMRLNPGHYVSLIIPLPISSEDNNNHQNNNNDDNKDGKVKTVRFTRVKLLRPNETLALGHAYRLVTTQEVMKVLKAKKYAKAAKKQREGSDGSDHDDVEIHHDHQTSSNCVQQGKSEKKMSQAANRQRVSSANAGVTRSKSWRPSLQSISETTS